MYVSGLVLGDKPEQSRCYRSRSSSWRETEDAVCFLGSYQHVEKTISQKKNYKVSSHVTGYLVTMYDLCCQRTVVYLECQDYECTENAWVTEDKPFTQRWANRFKEKKCLAQDLVVKIVFIRSKVSLRTLLCHFPQKFVSVNNPAVSTLYQNHLRENSASTNNETKRKGHYWLSSSICQVLCCVSGSKYLQVPLFSGEQNIQAWPSPDWHSEPVSTTFQV